MAEARRLILQNELEELMGNKHVYYDAPENLKMEYPAIQYSKSKIDSRHANDKIYKKMTKYEVIVISRKPDNPVIDGLLELPYCSFDRHYISDNLHHDVLTLYY